MKRLLTLLAIFLCVGFSFSQEDTIKSLEFEEITISAIPQKEIAFKSPRHFILDFHIDSTGTFLLLKHFNQYSIQTLDNSFKKTFEMPLFFHPRFLFSDCMGNLYVLSKLFMYQLKIIDGELTIIDKIPANYYDYIKDCVAVNNKGLIFKILRYNNQSTEYYQEDNTDSLIYDIYTIENRELERSVRETQEELARREESLRRKYDGDVNQRSLTWEEQTRSLNPRSGAGVEIREFMDQKAFFNNFVIQPYYNPLFVYNDTTLVFDHVNGQMVRITEERNIVSKVPISYQNEKKWKGEMHLDDSRGNIYSVEEKHGAQIFGLISMNKGKIIRRSKITRHAFPEKIIVYRGHAYYLYKEYFEDNLNKLFRQKL